LVFPCGYRICQGETVSSLPTSVDVKAQKVVKISALAQQRSFDPDNHYNGQKNATG
jgi:hypothetical protein